MDAQEHAIVGPAPASVEPRFTILLSLTSLFLLLLGALYDTRRRNFALRRRSKRNLVVPVQRRRHQRTLTFCKWITRVMGQVVRALWRGIKACCRRAQLLPPLPAAAAAAAAIASAPLETTEDDLALAIPQHFCHIIIWNWDSLVQGSTNIMDSFKQINHPIQYGPGCSPNASNCSSPINYEFHNGFASGCEENNEQHLQFKPFSLLDHGDVKLIDSTSLCQLDHMICQCQIVGSRYQQMLYKVFADNSDLLDSFLSKSFNSAGLCIDKKACIDASHTYQSAKRCVMILKTAAGLLSALWKELAETSCHSFHQDLKNHYFAVCARRPMQNIIEAALSISSMTWSASNIYQMLVLYEAIIDVLPAVQNLRLGCPNESDRIFQQMTVNFKGVFNGIKCSIHDNLKGSQNGMMHVRHHGTDLLIRYMNLFKNHRNVVQQISCFGDGSVSLGHLLSEVICYWARELEKHSKLYTEGRCYIFVLNNLTYFDKEIMDLEQVLVHNSNREGVVNLLDSLISKSTSGYLQECWGPVRDSLELNSGGIPRRSLLTVFTSKFDDIYDCQRTWVLHPQLKEKLRGEIRDFITPSYDTFLTELHKRPAPRLRLPRQKFAFLFWRHRSVLYRTVEELGSAVEELFESEHIQ